MFDHLRSRLHHPVPLRFLLLGWLDTRFNFLSYAQKLNYDTVPKPAYGYCLLQAALLARRLDTTASLRSSSAWLEVTG